MKTSTNRNQKHPRRRSGVTPPPHVEMEWAQINDRQVVVATADQMWIHELDQAAGQDPFAEPMSGLGSLATTRQLLDAAWCAGLMAARNERPASGKTLPGYVWELIGYHFLTSHSSGLLTEAAAIFRHAGRPDLETFARHFSDLEAGDEAMAIADLEALGYDAAALVRHCPPPPSTVAYYNYWLSLVRSHEPVTAFGYAYAVERTSLSVNQEDLQVYEQLLPPGVNAISCRWHHSGVGGDVAHVKYQILATSRLPAQDRTRIARAVYDAMRFFDTVPADNGVDAAALEARFSAYRTRSAARPTTHLAA